MRCQSIGVSALASFLPKKSQGWSPSEWTGWISLQSKGLSRVFSNTKVQAGRVWGEEEKGTTEDEMAGWHHWLNGHESEWTPGVGDGNSFKPHKNACNTWKLGSLLSPCHRWGNWGCLINLRSLHRRCPVTVAAPSPLGTEPVYPGLTCWRSQLPHLVALTGAWGPWHGEIGYHLVTEPIAHPTLGWQGLVCFVLLVMADFTTLLKEVLRPRQGDPLDRFVFNDNTVSTYMPFSCARFCPKYSCA